jgi:adenosylcobinamide-GDP ribazoletransferase
MLLKLISSFLGALTFYTVIPLPNQWKLDFGQMARWLPIIGLIIGVVLAMVDLIFGYLGMPMLTRSVLIIALWLGMTGGLHLDGVMDTADGLAVMDAQRRLDVMRDSVTGAFGVMAGVMVLLLKIGALSDLSSWRWLALLLVTGCSRWGQLRAIAFYPYLRPTGKGMFPKQGVKPWTDTLLGLAILGLISAILGGVALQLLLINLIVTVMVAHFFYLKLGGFTGDVYGAVVEWSEAIALCCFTVILN